MTPDATAMTGVLIKYEIPAPTRIAATPSHRPPSRWVTSRAGNLTAATQTPDGASRPKPTGVRCTPGPAGMPQCMIA